MKLWRIKAWFWITLFPFLMGCDQTIKYNKELFKPDQDSCWPCKMYMQAFTAIQTAMEKAMPIMCDNCRYLLIKVAFPLWLLYKLAPWVISFKEPEYQRDLKEIFITSFKCLIVVILLSVKTGTSTYNDNYSIKFSSPGGKSVRTMSVSLADTEKAAGRSGVQIEASSGKYMIYDVAGKMFLEPIGDIFLGVSQLALATPSSVGISMSNYTEGSSGLGGTIGNFFKDIFDKVSGGAFSDNISDIATKIQGLYTGTQIAEDPMLGKLPMKIQSIVWILYDSLWSGMGLAFQLFQMNSIAAFLSGILIFFAMMAMMVKLPLAFVEAVLYIGITVILMPLYLLYWVFPVTSKDILKKLFHQLFSAFFDILFYCIYVAFLVSVLRIYIESDQSIAYLFSSDFQSQESGLRKAATNVNTSFIIMTILIWTILKLFDHVTEYSSYFFDGAGQKSNIVQFLDRVKKMAYEAGKGAVVAVAGVATGNFGMAGKALVSGTKNVTEEAQGMVKDAQDNANK